MDPRKLFGVALLLITNVATAEGPDVRARLVADGAGVGPGGRIRVGVLFEMEPGWHIYWKNPGDSGLSTTVEWVLPVGVAAGPLRWPVPIRFVQPGELVAYGYEGTVLLASELGMVEELPAGGVEIGASVSWLACKKECVPGSADLRERLPPPVEVDVFEAWQSSLPGEGGPFSSSTVGAINPTSRRGELSIWLEWAEAPPTVEWFPEAGERLKLTDVRVRTRGKLTRIDFSAAVIGAGGGTVDNLRSVVVADDGGRRRGWELTVNLANSS